MLTRTLLLGLVVFVAACHAQPQAQRPVPSNRSAIHRTAAPHSHRSTGEAPPTRFTETIQVRRDPCAPQPIEVPTSVAVLHEVILTGHESCAHERIILRNVAYGR